MSEKYEITSNKEKYKLDDILDKQEYKYDYKSLRFTSLKEKDFYPPEDNRFWESYVEDIEDGDTFADYCQYIFDLLEEEGYYE